MICVWQWVLCDIDLDIVVSMKVPSSKSTNRLVTDKKEFDMVHESSQPEYAGCRAETGLWY